MKLWNNWAACWIQRHKLKLNMLIVLQTIIYKRLIAVRVGAAVAASRAFQRSDFLLSTISFWQLLPICFAVLCASWTAAANILFIRAFDALPLCFWSPNYTVFLLMVYCCHSRVQSGVTPCRSTVQGTVEISYCHCILRPSPRIQCYSGCVYLDFGPYVVCPSRVATVLFVYVVTVVTVLDASVASLRHSGHAETERSSSVLHGPSVVW